MWKFCTTSENSELLQRYGFQKCTGSSLYAAFSGLFHGIQMFTFPKKENKNVLLMHTITFLKYTIMFKNDQRAMHYYNSLWYEDMTSFIFSILCKKKKVRKENLWTTTCNI